MRKIFCILSCLLVAGCTSFDRNPYDGALRELRVTAVYPEGYAGYLREGVAVKLSDRNTGNVYTALTDAQGHAGFRVAAGHYRLSVLDLPDDSAVFNGTIEQVDLVGGDKDVDVALKFSKPGTILIKEIYSGGCMQDPPATGTYADDKYIVLHNNSFETYYLDGLCLAMVAPYNSNANNPWTSTDPSGNIVFRDYAAIPDCIWMFPGSGTDFPLEPGEDAVVAYYGVDHTQTYSQSVNLNRKGYFVLYDMVHYPGNKLHPTPVPGDQIDQAHYMKVLKKTGTNSAVVYVISQNSPAVILFRAPEGFDLDAYLADDLQSTVQNGSITYSKIPWDNDWIVDGVEVCNMTEATKNKRLHTDVDAGYIGFSAKAQGHTLHRKLDEEATAAAGFERYVDTNNSSNDFYERETQSLRD
ncbi:Uncharacterised protein [Alistipes finegoldii]|nr:Uncharacterised protein [Alistipes finegoldii]